MISTFQTIAFFVFPFAMAFAAISDLFTMTISNRLVLALLAAFAVLAPLAGLDARTLGLDALAGAIVLAIAFGCFAAGWIGGGDAKFAAVTTLWIGWSNAVDFIAMSAIFGGVLTLVILSFRRAVLPAFVVRQAWVARLHHQGGGVPYGVALAAGGLAVYPHTAWMAAFLS
ncbi:MAG TPA: prepilin peptidase [Bauldia sp.]|nr:prepilin peptidase [Bauldia sp.]HVZ15032.1 prepilin peptidase [Bauldia sp.]